MNFAVRGLCTWRLGFLSVIALAAILLAGCGGSDQGSGTTSGTPQPGGTLRVAEEGEVDSLNPTTTILVPDISVLNQLVEGLFRVDEEQEAQPWLIERYETSDDLRDWTFHLKPNIRFSDGQKMTAADVVFSIDAVRKSAVWSGVFEPITSVSAASPTTVELKTSVPSPALPYLLSIYPAGIVPKDFGGKSEAEFGEDPVGTGPFKLASWKRGQSLTLERNPHYWKSGLPYLDEVVYLSAPDDNSRVAQLKAGSLDVIAKPSWAQLSGVEATPGITISKAEDVFVGSVLVNARRPLFKDPQAREALNLGMDRSAITEAALKGQGQAAPAWYPLSMRYADRSLEAPEQDVEKAKQLLSAAVASSGDDSELSLLYIGEEEYARTSAQVIQAQLQEAGFTVTLRPSDEATLFSELEAGDFDLLLTKSFPLVPDPVEWFGYYPSTEALFTGAPVEGIEKLINKAAQEIDPDKRRDLYQRIQQQMVGENFVLNINDYPVVYAHSDRAQNVRLLSTGTLRLGEVWLAD